MPKGVIVPAEVKERALELYLQEKQFSEIAKILALEFPEEAVKESAIYEWVKLYGWKGKKAEVKAIALQRLTTDGAIDVRSLTEKQLDAYRQIREKGLEELGDLPFKKALDAAMAVDIGAKGERKIVMGLVAVSFVQDVIQVLTEEIEDTNVLKRISDRLKRLVVQAQDT